MIDEFVEKTQNTNKKTVDRSLVVCENFVTRKGPSTHVIDATSFVKMQNATIEAEELANISSYQTL